jgi:hypothetical protein
VDAWAAAGYDVENGLSLGGHCVDSRSLADLIESTKRIEGGVGQRQLALAAIFASRAGPCIKPATNGLEIRWS